jgi:16S rRNA (guanine527-N7)-methyltransferase
MTLRPLHDAWIPLLSRAAEKWVADTGLDGPEPSRLGEVASLLDRVATWTARVDLTAARDAESLVELYLVDALPLGTMLAKDTTSVVDVGSGGGAPGLTLAILRPEIRVTLVEPRAKRVAFLRTSAAALECNNVDVRRRRSEELPSRGFQDAMSRATFAPQQWLEEGARLAVRSVWVFLAKADPPALAGWRLEHDVAYELPFSGAPRRIVGFRREEATSASASSAGT